MKNNNISSYFHGSERELQNMRLIAGNLLEGAIWLNKEIPDCLTYPEIRQLVKGIFDGFYLILCADVEQYWRPYTMTPDLLAELFDEAPEIRKLKHSYVHMGCRYTLPLFMEILSALHLFEEGREFQSIDELVEALRMTPDSFSPDALKLLNFVAFFVYRYDLKSREIWKQKRPLPPARTVKPGQLDYLMEAVLESASKEDRTVDSGYIM